MPSININDIEKKAKDYKGRRSSVSKRGIDSFFKPVVPTAEVKKEPVDEVQSANKPLRKENRSKPIARSTRSLDQSDEVARLKAELEAQKKKLDLEKSKVNYKSSPSTSAHKHIILSIQEHVTKAPVFNNKSVDFKTLRSIGELWNSLSQPESLLYMLLIKLSNDGTLKNIHISNDMAEEAGIRPKYLKDARDGLIDKGLIVTTLAKKSEKTRTVHFYSLKEFTRDS
jgi:hypothetical protein